MESTNSNSTVRDCNSCISHVQGRSLEKSPAKCWDCTRTESLVHWEAKEKDSQILSDAKEPKENLKVLVTRAIARSTASHHSVTPGKTSSAVSDGSTASYYVLPKEAAELQDLISTKNMNAQIGEIFRECYRYGQASHCDELRGINKILFYANAEKKRLVNNGKTK